jgi:hypothetical protein
MTKKAPTKTATREATVTTVRRRRLTNVQTRQGDALTSTEENTLRMHHGLDVGLHTPLPTNAINAAIRQQLLEIEIRAYEATGRYLDRAEVDGKSETDATPAKPRRSAKDKIVASLRKR